MNHPLNKAVLEYFKRRWDGTHPQNVSAPPSIYDLNKNPLGTHPDLADYFWNQLTAKLPKSCAWVVYGNPVLIHPASGVIFGFAGGTHTYALRLPDQTLQEAISAGAKRVYKYSNGETLSLDILGDAWVFGGWFKQEPDWCLAAYKNFEP